MIVWTVIEYFTEILKPSLINYWPVCNNYGALHFHILGNSESAKGFTKTHFGIPKHFIMLAELLLRLLYCCFLLRSKNNRILCLANVARMKAGLAMLNGSNGLLDSFKVATIPFIGSLNRIENLLFHTGPLQNTMHLFVVERANCTSFYKKGHLCV